MFVDFVLGIGAIGSVCIFRIINSFIVIPHMVRIIVVCKKLAVIPEERIDELLVRITGAANFSQSPFPESCGFVTGFFEYFEELPRMQVFPVCIPVTRLQREGALTVVPE